MVAVTPINDIEKTETNNTKKAEEPIQILRPSNRRVDINELIEKQNAGLDKIRQMSEIANEVGISVGNEDITMVTEEKKEVVNKEIINDEIVPTDAFSEELKNEDPIFDYNAPINDTAFASQDEEKAIFENLNETLNSINKTSEASKKQAEEIKKQIEEIQQNKNETVSKEVQQVKPVEESEEVYVVEENKEDDTFVINVDEKEIEVEEKVTVEEPELNKESEENSFTIENNDDNSIFTSVETLLEDDLYNKTEDPASSIVVPLSDVETISSAVIDSDPESYKEVIRVNPQYRGFVNTLRRTVDNPRTYLHRLHKANELFYSAQQNFNRDALNAAVERNKSSKNLTRSAKIGDKIVQDVMADKNEALRKIADGATIKGNSLAVNTTVLLTQGIKKVNLFNSGFHLSLRAPMLSELADYWRDTTSTEEEYGRLLGQLSYLPANIKYKVAAMDLVEKLAVGSNLTGYNTSGVLRKAISFLDYETVLWAIGSLMYPKGLEIDYLCHNNNCRYVEKGKISVSDMRYNDWSLLSSDSIAYTMSNTERSLEDLEKYRESIGNRDVTKKINDEWSALLRVPTMHEVIEANLAQLSDLIKRVQLTSLKEASMYVAVKYYGILAPFVDRLAYRSKDTGKVIYIKDNIPSSLEALQSGEDINFSKTVDDFIDEKKITHICFTVNKCPGCGSLPSSAIGHLIPCDVERVFFTWTIQKLTDQLSER